jgi:tetratricopeptide (TPR) repeat protein
MPQGVTEVIFVVRDTMGGASIRQLTVELTGETQDGTIYTGTPRNRGEQWVFEVPGPGTYTAEVSAPGYKTLREPVTITERTGDHLRIDLRLEPSSNSGKGSGSLILAPKARAELDKGKQALNAKQFDEAKAHLEKALQLAPTSSEVNYYAGLLYYYTGNMSAAVDHVQKSISMDPGNGQPLFTLGDVYYSQKDYPRAITVLEQGLVLQPGSWRAEAVLGNAYFKQADYEKGREHAQKALKIGKDEASAVGLLLGKCLAALDKKQEAVAALQTLLDQRPAPDVTKAAQDLLNKLQASP